MLPVGFLLQFDTKVLRYESVFIINNNKIVLNSLIFWGWVFVTYGIDTEVIHSGIVSQNYGIEPSLVPTLNFDCIFAQSQINLWTLVVQPPQST